MAKKRFTDAEIWKKKWYRKLDLKMKLLWNYLKDNCDNAGIIEFDEAVASLQIGADVSNEDVIKTFGDRVKRLDEDKFFLLDFVRFQYGDLSEKCKPHRPIIQNLERNGLIDLVSKKDPKPKIRVSNTLTDVPQRVYKTLEEEEKEQEQEKEKEKEKEKDSEIENTLFDSVVQLWNTQLGGHRKFQHCRGLKPAQVDGFFQLIKKYKAFRDVATWNQIFTRVKAHPFLNGSKSPDAWVCSLGWLCEDYHALGVLNGEYGSESAASEVGGKSYEEVQREWAEYQEKLRGAQ